MKNLKPALGEGFVGGLLGSLCCTAPLAIVLLGLSGVSGAMALVERLQQHYRWTLFVPLAIAFLAGAIYLHIKRREGTCNTQLLKQYKGYILTTIAFAAIVWALLLYVLVPAAFGALQ